ncbi:antibiotic biosynthesis monooxygenase family protein [Fervidibacillus albus]|uniref:Antibiotic biosynthesis monooxygenase n=1 Tax=Fervidibacillus albus TaxID=2980026 RepID=A0A9E8LSI2_9BACI|nr:antibiotic biosynthesis monooxygenase [Fervidibacillus albus]WAA08707.1 antibiotic biosynthesis monooxygenase [Fervidibacillus albus]
MKKVYVATGTADYLKSIEKKFPDEKLLFMENVEHALLFHETDGKSIFQRPRAYFVVEACGLLPAKGYATFFYIPVLDEEKSAFEHSMRRLLKTFHDALGFYAFRLLRPRKGDLYAIVTCWDCESSFKKWHKHGYIYQLWTAKNLEMSKSMNYPNPTYYKGYKIGKDKEK